jgi:hypothetical protein
MLFTDNLELLDLKDCLLIEQEEKNELSKKIQELEKECECVSLLSFPIVQIVPLAFELCIVVHTNLSCFRLIKK